MLFAQDPLAGLEGAPEQALGLAIAALGPVKLRQALQVSAQSKHYLQTIKVNKGTSLYIVDVRQGHIRINTILYSLKFS